MVDVETETKAAWAADEGDESGHGPDGILAGVLASYRERGFETGYRRAVSDVLATFLLATEEYVRRHPDDPALRGVLYDFGEVVDSHLRRMRPGRGEYVADGLGI